MTIIIVPVNDLGMPFTPRTKKKVFFMSFPVHPV